MKWRSVRYRLRLLPFEPKCEKTHIWYCYKYKCRLKVCYISTLKNSAPPGFSLKCTCKNWPKCTTKNYVQRIYTFSSVIHNKINDRNRINGCTKLRGNTEIFLSPNFASLLIAVDADQCSSFTRFPQFHNSAFTMVRFHHDITSCIIYKKNDLRFHTAVKVHARVCSSRALNFPESRRKEPVRTSLCFWPKRRSDPGISHYFLATTGINHLILYPVALCNFSFVRLVGSCVSFLTVHIARKDVPLRKWTFKNLLSSYKKYRVNTHARYFDA